MSASPLAQEGVSRFTAGGLMTTSEDSSYGWDAANGELWAVLRGHQAP
jgi:hypothetical protein